MSNAAFINIKRIIEELEKEEDIDALPLSIDFDPESVSIKLETDSFTVELFEDGTYSVYESDEDIEEEA